MTRRTSPHGDSRQHRVYDALGGAGDRSRFGDRVAVPDPLASEEAAYRFNHEDLSELDERALRVEFARAIVGLAQTVDAEDLAWFDERFEAVQGERRRRWAARR